ncbi:Ig-like domain-containing protein [Saccharicrinis carchari]|uniref:Ig-like domain-containing protein n=1 Tax=Saccharicrinis carchari TaxID=1168039 RepID=A0A521D5H4_SACCC|nr:Ig-like domain-containing protein [Saccharicrinis carchari]SMO66140.1 Ig-like domain-containing protein [Saccharicrinis carchari]
MRHYIFGLLAMLLLLYSCANPGYPTGGPKDMDPPKIKKSTPKPNALNFNKKQITIEFDEIIKLNDVYQKFVVSPPLKKRPTIVERANKLSIEFDEEEVLQENTTYTLDFADAVEDNNEGNAIESFVFSFSTGEVVDSFAIMGNLWEAFDLAPVEGALVMVHKNLNDTAFTHDVPVRLGKTNKEGRFAIRNLSPGNYRVYAIEDGNRNYMFDQPGEYIAWLDTIVSPAMEYVEMPDTIAPDSVIYSEELVYTPNDLKLFLFKEESTQQYQLGEERKDSNTLAFFFNLPLEDFSLQPVLDEPFDEDWAVFEPTAKNDTMFVWITDSALYKRDTLTMAFSYLGLDSLNNPAQINDTVRMYYFELPKKKESRRQKKGVPEKVKTLQLARSPSTVDVYSSFDFIMPTPVKLMDETAIGLLEKVDTLWEERDFVLRQDSTFKRRYSVSRKWTPGANYLLSVDSAAIEDVYGLKNDSIGKKFSVKTLESYGVLLIDLGYGEDDWLLQLLDNSEKVVRQKYVPNSGKVGFEYLNVGSYSLKLVLDRNKNGKWDTGNYARKLQPEQVFYYPEKVDVRANWEVVVKWELEKFDIYDFVEKNRRPKKRDEL